MPSTPNCKKGSPPHWRGADHPKWKGGKTVAGGYVFVKQHGHPRAHANTGYVQEHVLIAEQALRKRLPPRAVIHHINEDRQDNRPENLVICEDRKYHMLLHQRLRAYRETGNPDARKCWRCKRYDIIGNLKVYGTTVVHQGSRCHA